MSSLNPGVKAVMLMTPSRQLKNVKPQQRFTHQPTPIMHQRLMQDTYLPVAFMRNQIALDLTLMTQAHSQLVIPQLVGFVKSKQELLHLTL
jgi:hypothetical protein